MTPYILLVLGLLLILLEFFLPGAILGALGAIALFASIILFAMNAQSFVALILYILAVTVLVVLLIRFALWRIRTAPPDYSIYSNANQEGYVASSYNATLIGKKGVVLTDLKPGGHILIEGKRVQAISQGGYLVKGSEVVVIGGQEESLIVKHIKKDTEA
jgi:membrane-bound ClpP family serine protease